MDQPRSRATIRILKVFNCIRPSIVGEWRGNWQNDLNQKGEESLNLRQEVKDRLSGVWSSNVPIQGQRIGPDVIYFTGNTDQRQYQCIGLFQGNRLRLKYCAPRVQQSGRYYGWAELARHGSNGEASISARSVNMPREKRRSLTGTWNGTYENSLSSTR